MFTPSSNVPQRRMIKSHSELLLDDSNLLSAPRPARLFKSGSSETGTINTEGRVWSFLLEVQLPQNSPEGGPILGRVRWS